MRLKFLISKYLFIILFSFNNIVANENEDIKTDILFLKIQELESEIADLRNRIESQNFLIEKLIQESFDNQLDNKEDEIEELTLNSDIRFEGIDDPRSKEQIYDAAIQALESQNFERAFNLYKYFVDSFNDKEKRPLSLFWLGEISMINNDLENAEVFFMELISKYPSHYRIPLSHKKIGDIYLKSNQTENAREKYKFVIREYPNSTASSLALQLLKNME